MKLYFCAVERNLHIDPDRGNIYDFGGIEHQILEDRFTLKGRTVTWKGAPVSLYRLASESMISFREEGEGYVLNDPLDKRVGKGMGIKMSGELYRV